MYPISGDIRSIPRRPSSPASTGGRRVVPARVEGPAAPRRAVDGDVEVEVRLFADGRSITVRRTIAPGPDGAPMTVGIDALVR